MIHLIHRQVIIKFSGNGRDSEVGYHHKTVDQHFGQRQIKREISTGLEEIYFLSVHNTGNLL